MVSETSKRAYCSGCKEVTEHVKVSLSNPQALKDIYDEYYRNHPEDLRSGLYKAYPD